VRDALDDSIKDVFVEVDGLRFHTLAAGPSDGPLVLLLHGFPEFSRSWRHQLPALAAAGYRAVAPDLRGYAQTDKRGPYDLATLVDDLAGLVRALGREHAAVVGHDWGGAIAWMAAHRRPELVERLAVLNAPHPAAIAREVFRNPRQLLRSAYVLAFLVPRLPERLLTARRARAVVTILGAGARVKSAWPPDELERYREAFLEPGAATAALGYYRALARRRGWAGRVAKRHPIDVPVLLVWGVEDPAVGRELADRERLEPWLAAGNRPTIQRLEGVGHFVQNEAPEPVTEALLAFLGAPMS
jgi:pimeloyl-ACP methyl ester carboxylesterase